MNNLVFTSRPTDFTIFDEYVSTLNLDHSESGKSTYFPQITTEEKKKIKHIYYECQPDFKKANNPKEIANFATQMFKLIRDQSHTTEEKITHLEKLKTLVHHYTLYCEERTESSWIEQIKSWFGIGKRAGLDKAHQVDHLIENEIASIRKEVENLDKLHHEPNFQNTVTEQKNAEKFLFGMNESSNILWINEEGKIVRSIHFYVRDPYYPGQMEYIHEVFKSATDYYAKQELSRTWDPKKMVHIGDLDKENTKPVEASENEMTNRKLGSQYKHLLNLPVYRPLTIPNAKQQNNRFWNEKPNEPAATEIKFMSPIELVLKDGSQEAKKVGKAVFRILPRKENNQIVAFSLFAIGAPFGKQAKMRFLEYLIKPTLNGFNIQLLSRRPGSDTLANPSTEYDSIEKFLKERNFLGEIAKHYSTGMATLDRDDEDTEFIDL